MANLDLTADDLNYDFDSRSDPYIQAQAWSVTMNQMEPIHADPRRHLSPINTGADGLRQTTMGEHPMMEDWRFQQHQHHQHQHQQQQHNHHHQHVQHHHQQNLSQHGQQYQHQTRHQAIQYQQPQQRQQQQHPHAHMPTQPTIDFAQTHHNTIEADFGGVFSSIPMPSHLNMMPVTQTSLPTSLPLEQSYMPLSTAIEGMPQSWAEFSSELVSYITVDAGALSSCPPQSSSPTGSHLEVSSQPSSSDEPGWTMIDGRTSFETYDRPFFVDPAHTLHDRTLSESSYSDVDQSGQTTFLSNLDMGAGQAVYSPTTLSDSDYECAHSYHPHHRLSIEPSPNIPAAVNQVSLSLPVPIPASSKVSSPVRSPGSQGSAGSPGRKPTKKSAIVAKGTERITKKTSQGGKNDEKRVGKRKGPLKPEQRKQASEIRKLRACLRCKFLKKTCDKGEPCAGCQPSHARLWQVPCTRIDIKEIGYFLKDKKFDYERHVSLGFSVGNIKGFSDVEKTLFITHGYGHMLPVTAREVYVRDEKCMKMDWMEGSNLPAGYEVSTAKLSAGTEGISTTMLSDYLDRHIDGTGTFEKFIDDYFEGTPFLSQMLKAAYHFYFRTHSKIIKKALKLMLAYSLTLHITMIEGIPAEEAFSGKIEDHSSRYYGKTMAPVMINFQIKCAMADMWRELHKDVLEELSSLYSSVYSGDKLKNWPTIFILASVLLAVWECMQFDCHYRVPDETAVDKFCSDMETTPVGVIVGLFSAISQKLPSILEWDTTKHHTLLGSNWDVCDTMTEVREHVARYENYLRDRPNAKFDSKDFDSLSNKFLSRLVLRDIRAN